MSELKLFPGAPSDLRNKLKQSVKRLNDEREEIIQTEKGFYNKTQAMFFPADMARQIGAVRSAGRIGVGSALPPKRTLGALVHEAGHFYTAPYLRGSSGKGPVWRAGKYFVDKKKKAHKIQENMSRIFGYGDSKMSQDDKNLLRHELRGLGVNPDLADKMTKPDDLFAKTIINEKGKRVRLPEIERSAEAFKEQFIEWMNKDPERRRALRDISIRATGAQSNRANREDPINFSFDKIKKSIEPSSGYTEMLKKLKGKI